MKKTYCDLCGKQIYVSKKLTILVDCIDKGKKTKEEHTFEDVCPDCFDEVRMAESQKYVEICLRNNVGAYKKIII